jgi:hypothetical protein
MQERRKHQRIRFAAPPAIRLGYGGSIGQGVVENLSLSGLMVRTPLELDVSRQVGCEFKVGQSPLIDVPATVVNRVGDLYGLRFQTGPIAQVLIDDAINASLASGQASILSMHEQGGFKVMRIIGGLNGTLKNDFMYALTRVGVDRIDLSGVTAVEQAGVALCLLATGRYGAMLGEQSACFADAWKLALAMPGTPLGDDGWASATQIFGKS